MRMEERRRLLATLKEGFDNGGPVQGDGVASSPLADLTCPQPLAEEQRVFFRETPLFMGLSADLPAPGSYWADSQAGLPILMARGEDGAFRAFANSCRHRGAQVVADGRGRRTRFSRPFHAWTYDARGNLAAINRERRFGGDIDLDATLGGLQDDLAHWDLPAYRYAASQALHANINWKLAIDAFGENCHFDVLHRQSLSRDIRGNPQTHDVFGNRYALFGRNEPALLHHHNAHRRGLGRPLLSATPAAAECPTPALGNAGSAGSNASNAQAPRSAA